MAAPAGGTGGTTGTGRRASSTASVAALKAADLTTEDGYRKWTKVASELTKAEGEEFAFAAELLRKILLRTPLSNPKTGTFSGGYDAKRTPRRIAAYLKRAADAQRFAEGQIKTAFKLFEQAYVIEVQGAPKGMKLNRDGKKSGGRSGTAGKTGT